ncbi:MAG: HemK family protein methyltransferase [Myxococcales bacterium]
MTENALRSSPAPATADPEAPRVFQALQVGHATFMGLDLLVAPGVLVPREETELLGHAAREILAGAALPPALLHLVDLCCGAGNLACALASASERVRAWATDLTDSCVELARQNVEHLGLGERIRVAQGDLFAGLAGLGLEGTVDVVVCNPPYISTGRLETQLRGLLEKEPREAFDAGPYGLRIHQRVVKEALPFLRPGGWLMFEVGVGQERQVDMLFNRAGGYEPPQHRQDAMGRVRVVLAQKKNG